MLRAAQVGLWLLCGTFQFQLFWSHSNITCHLLQNSVEEKDKDTVKVDSVLILHRWDDTGTE